jgi:hypothetical protein
MLHKVPSVYGSIEHTFYAFEIDNPPLIPDMWDPKKPDKQPSSPKDCTYFSLNTMVGVGAKGQNNIKSVHIRFVLMPMEDGLPAPEVVSIHPTNISKPVGWITETQRYENERSTGGGVKVSGGIGSIFARMGAFLGVGFRKQFSSSKIKESKLPNQLLIANASGTANRAIWEFYRGDGIEAIGQYNLEIIFRLRRQENKPPYGKYCCYCVDWNVEVNRRKLLDHKAELENDKWNVKFNGRKLMYPAKDEEKKVFRTMQNYRIENDDEEEEAVLPRLLKTLQDILHNRIIQKKREKYRKESEKKYEEKMQMTIDDIEQIEIEEKIGERLVELMLEDDPDMKNRLLRPLVLFRNNEENQPPQGLYPYLSSWKTNIENINSCQNFVIIEAIVLSNPRYIKKRHSKSHELKDITYILLGDDTGVIVLIQDNETFGNRLNNLKMDNRIRVIGAKADRVFYDIDGIKGVLKSREIDLYITRSTWFEPCKEKTEITTPPAAVQYLI